MPVTYAEALHIVRATPEGLVCWYTDIRDHYASKSVTLAEWSQVFERFSHMSGLHVRVSLLLKFQHGLLVGDRICE